MFMQPTCRPFTIILAYSHWRSVELVFCAPWWSSTGETKSMILVLLVVISFNLSKLPSARDLASVSASPGVLIEIIREVSYKSVAMSSVLCTAATTWSGLCQAEGLQLLACQGNQDYTWGLRRPLLRRIASEVWSLYLFAVSYSVRWIRR